jgi:hypothetical protein
MAHARVSSVKVLLLLFRLQTGELTLWNDVDDKILAVLLFDCTMHSGVSYS